jgi:DNA-binding NarL/FixJ family response regulator
MSLVEAASLGERGLEVARQSRSRSAEAYALWQLAFCLGPQGEYTRARACGEEALAIAREIGHSQWETGAECALGGLFTDLLAADLAQLHLSRAVKLSRDIGSETWLGQAAALLVDALLLERRLRDAQEVLNSAPHLPDTGVASFGRRHLVTAEAELALALGSYERALEIVGRLEDAAEESVPGRTSIRLGRLRALAEAGLGRYSEALTSLETALSVAESQSQQSYRWRLLADMSATCWASDQREAAREAASRAVGLIDTLATRIDDDLLRQNFTVRAIDRLPSPLRRRARDHVDVLTAREAEIATLIARGLTNREIAETLVLSARTVETHVANAMSKTGFANRSQLAAWAVEHGLTSDA